MKSPIIGSDQIKNILEKMRQLKILIVGDIMLDNFIWGNVDRISPEAPVPVVKVTKESAYPGGAANVARNLADFGIPSVMCGIVGYDETGRKLEHHLLAAKIATNGLIKVDGYQTIRKTRIVAHHQQVVRIDREKPFHFDDETFEIFKERMDALIKDVDAVIIEDYAKGFITQNVVEYAIKVAKNYGKIITVDPNPRNPIDWHGIDMIKPNRNEAFAVTNIPKDDTHESLLTVGEKLRSIWEAPNLLITLGEEGMMLFSGDEEPFLTPTKAKEVYDVSGAGDTVIAFYTAALAAGLSPKQAAEIANHAAGIVVGKLGTATLTPEELEASFENDDE